MAVRERDDKMKCDFCKKEFRDSELDEISITAMDDNDNPIDEMKTFKVCGRCHAVVLALASAQEEE